MPLDQSEARLLSHTPNHEELQHKIDRAKGDLNKFCVDILDLCLDNCDSSCPGMCVQLMELGRILQGTTAPRSSLQA